MAAYQGSNTSITFPTSFAAVCTGISWGGVTREAINDTLITDSAGPITYIPDSWYDAGEVTFECQFDGDEVPPLQDVAGNLAINWGNSGTWTVTAHATSYDISAEIGSMITATVSFKCSGTIAIS